MPTFGFFSEKEALLADAEPFASGIFDNKRRMPSRASDSNVVPHGTLPRYRIHEDALPPDHAGSQAARPETMPVSIEIK
jgi:hypothetical protein